MSFSSKNPPPWSLSNNSGAGAPPPSLQAQMGLPNPMVNFQAQAQPVFSQGLTISTPQAPPPPSISLISPAPTLNPLYTQTVSYPTPRTLNTIAYPQAPTHQLQHPQLTPQQMSPQAQQLMNPMPPGVGPLQTAPLVSGGPTGVSSIMATQRAYTGTVTKIQGDVGFIDDEIFFHKSVVCKGSMPKVGERVFVEASYAQNTPFKWNASRVQLLNPSNSSNHGSSKPSYNNHENGSYHRSNSRSNHHSSAHHSRSPPRRSLDRTTSKREVSRDSDDHDRRRRPPLNRSDDRDKERRERRDFSPPSERRERSPASRNSTSNRVVATSPPPIKRRRIVPKYMIRIPKYPLTLKQVDIMELKQRYGNMYIPSDFFHSEVRWSESFTPDNPFVLHQPCGFHFMNKETSPPKELGIDESLIEPPDADNTFTAKVMLMSVPPMNEFYKECLMNAEDGEEAEKNLLHPNRMISFLVGERGRNETMGIGGPWSPSLDGKNPQSDPTVLIRTAIRTCKALTGIDLSRCSQWYRFMELYYHRRETGRVHTVVIYLPDIRSCLPTAEEWQTLKQQYKATMGSVIDQHQNHNSSKARNSNSTGSNKGDSTKAAAAAKEVKAAKESPEENGTADKSTTEGAEPEVGVAMETNAEKEEAAKDAVPEAEAGVVDKAESESPNEKETPADAKEMETEEVKETIDPKAMKLPELKEALNARNLPVKGLKADLVERLTEALAKEKEAQMDTKEASPPKSIEQPVEESNQSEEGQPDLANMVVIDECCDPTKQKSESPKEKAPGKANKKLDEKELRQLERRYTIPEAPEIIVHTSKTAKGGKFECSLMSLAMLRNYGQEDSKEHSFEVSLFAELFSEMLLRDSAYKIYRAMYNLPDRKDEEKVAAKDSKEETNKREESNKNDKKDDGKEDKETADEDSSEKRNRDKERKAQITVNHDLLLAFSFFGQTNYGYILTRDLEDLFSALGLSLSRSQIKKTIGKVTVSDSFYYRKLTDKDKDDTTSTEENKSTSGVESAIIAKGNFNQWPIFKTSIESNGSPTKNHSAKTGNADGGKLDKTGMIMHNGTLVNIDKLMERIKAAERALLDTEQVVANLKKENSDLVSSNSKSQTKIKDLISDVNATTKKLDSMANIQKKNSEYLSAFAAINDKIAPFLVKKEREGMERSTSRNPDVKDREAKVKVKQETKPNQTPSTAEDKEIKKEK